MINERFKGYLEEAIGQENALVAFSAFEQPASVSVRYNPFKPTDRMEGRVVPWCRYGLMLEHRPVFTLDPLFHAGAYYVQDSSSMFVGHSFRELISSVPRPVGRPFRVLDLCAAPGGKTTDLAASLREMFGDDFVLVSNEVMKARAGILADNVAIWGDPNVVVTSDDPRAFAALPEFFDVILADVPCSGEGMFRKDEDAQRQWSEDNVSLCQARQRRIVADVWPSLTEKGIFIYSTCTFNRMENDLNVAWIAEELGAEPMMKEDMLKGMPGVIKTGYGYSLVPGFVEGEGQYCSALRKSSERSGRTYCGRDAGMKADKPFAADKRIMAMFSVPVRLKERNTHVIAVPESISGDVKTVESVLHVIASGCAAGMMKGKDFVPDADLALSMILADDAFPTVEVDTETALAFLHRDAVILPDAERGYVLIRYQGRNLGFVKNIGNRCNNLHPQSRRIRMNIK